MKIDIKKVLLAGTAIVAVTGFGAAANAQNFTLTSDAIWASSAGATGANINNATAGQSVNIDGNTLTFTDGHAAGVEDAGNAAPTPADGGTAGVFEPGAITDTGAGNVIMTQSAGALTVSGTTMQVGNDLTIDNVDAADADVAATFTGAVTVGGNTLLTNNEADAANDVSLSVGGAYTATGSTTLVGGAFAGAATNLTVTGNATMTGGAVLTANTGGAVLTLNGATNNFGTGATLTGAGAQLFASSTGAQTFAGNIGGTGTVTVSHANGAVFGGTVAATGVVVESAAGDASATFRDDVTAAITLGGAGTGTNTITFSSSENMTVTGALNGSLLAETNNVNVAGGATVTQATAWGGGAGWLDTLSVTGTNTVLDSNANMMFTSVNIGTGAMIDSGAVLLTSAITNAGTLRVTGGTVTGDISGAGTLDVNATTSVTGSLVQGTTTIAEAADLTIVGGAARTVTTNVTLEDAAVDANDATLIFDNGAFTTTFTGNVTTQIDGEGEVNFADDAGATLAIVGNIGTSTAKVGTLASLGGAAQTLTTTGNVYANAININNVDTFQLLGTSAQTVHGIVTGGILTIGNGTAASNVTFSSTASVASANVAVGAAATFDGTAGTGAADVVIAGALDNDGTITLSSGVGMSAGTYTGDASAGADRFNFVASGNNGINSMGRLWVGAGAVDMSNDTIVFMVDPTSGILTPGSITFLSAANGQTITFTSANISDTSFLYNFDVSLAGATSEFANVTITAVDLASATTTSSNATVANVLLTDPELQATTDPNMLALIGSVQAASTQEEFNNALEQAQPTLDGSHMVAAVNTVNTSFDIMGDRLASLRTGDDITGMTTGNLSQGVRVWTQGFGATGEQDRRDNVDGFDFDTFGAAVGADTENIAEDTVLGVAFSYANTDADSDNGASTNTEVDSYQFSVYGDHDIDSRTYVNGMFAYTMNETETARLVAGATARGDFDADQFTTRVELGRDYQHGNTTLTPNVMGHWTHFSPDSYTETGAGGAGLHVEGDDLDIVELGLGVDASWVFRNSDGSYWSPVIEVGYRHDFSGDEIAATSRFIAGGQAFQTEGFDSQDDAVDAGVGFTYYSTDNWELTAEYDYTWNEDFVAHAGMARAAYRF